MNARIVRIALLAIASVLLTVLALVLFPQPGIVAATGTATTLVVLAGLILGQTFRPTAALLPTDEGRLPPGMVVGTVFAGLPAVVASAIVRPVATGDERTFVVALLWYAVPLVAIACLISVRHRAPDGLRNARKLVFFVGVAASVVLFVGFDHRYTGVLFAGLDSMSYTLNSLWVAAILLLVVRTLPGDDRDDLPFRFDRRSLLWGAIALGAIIVTIVPAGLATGFLRFAPQLPRDASGVVELVVAFLGIWLTIAIPEELVARAVLQRGVARIAGRWWVGLIVASVLFGAMHWNNAGPDYRLHYIGFASVAGVFYGVAYLKGGLGAAVLAHTAVDWVWALLLKR